MKLRRGFTLVELLVVIAIIGMLMGLLIPAVQSARERGRNTVCKNNMRQVALAIINYENTKKRLPGYVEKIGVDSSGNPVWRPMMALLLPHLDRRDLDDRLRSFPGSIPSPAFYSSPYSAYLTQGKLLYLEVLNCPSDPVFEGAHTAFAYNTGTPDDITGLPSTPPPQNPADGVFLWNAYGTLSISLDRIYDGQSTTIMLTENIQTGLWVNGAEALVGCVWWDVDPANLSSVTFFINRNREDGIEPYNNVVNEASASTSDLMNALRYARPSSRHPGSVNVAYCDAHVDALDESIDYITYAHLMTSKGRSCTASGPGTVGARVRNSVLGQ